MKSATKELSSEIRKTLDVISLINQDNLINFQKLCKETIQAFKKNKKIFFFGNGGSAAQAQHLAAELIVRYKKKRKSFPALALSTDTSILTSIGNDFSFTNIFSRQLEGLGSKGDIALAISTSGNSKNLVEGLKIAKKKELLTFCLSGNKGGLIKKFTKYPIIIPSKDTPTIQVIQLIIGHAFCSFIENQK
jgi:D-sedoheptulose 7-phosphate isomerase